MNFIYQYKDGKTKITINGREVRCGEISIHQTAISQPEINISEFHDLIDFEDLKKKQADCETTVEMIDYMGKTVETFHPNHGK